ncbi:MAG: hypothetical protein WBD46_13750 [Acidobacteriaceae bacterium]
MVQGTVDRYKELERQLYEQFPQARKDAEALAAGIANPDTADADAIWEHTWNKPLYANTRVDTGDAWIRKLKPHMPGAWRQWGLGDSFLLERPGKGSKNEAFKAQNSFTAQVRKETGIAMYRLFAIQGAAGALRERRKRSNTPYADLINIDPAEMVPLVQKEMGFGWGCITVLHFLTDLGLACKPDLNLMRTLRHLGMWNGRGTPTCEECIEINRRVRMLLERLDGSVTPARLRYLDKILMEISRYGLIGHDDESAPYCGRP